MTGSEDRNGNGSDPHMDTHGIGQSLDAYLSRGLDKKQEKLFAKLIEFLVADFLPLSSGSFPPPLGGCSSQPSRSFPFISARPSRLSAGRNIEEVANAFY